MSKIQKNSVTGKVNDIAANPQAIFESPEQVLEDSRFNREEKQKILEGWKHDAYELSIAENEGMIGGEQNMLHRVVRALESIASKNSQ